MDGLGQMMLPQAGQTAVPAPPVPMPMMPPGIQSQGQNQQLTPDMMQLMMQMLYASPPKQPQQPQPQMPPAMPQQVM